MTGAAQRIGRAIAVDLAAHGWAVALHHYLSAGAAAAVVEEIETAGGRAVTLDANLDVEDECRGLTERAAAELGVLTCLVNNASVFETDDPRTATRASWMRHMEVNLRAPFVLCQAFAAQLPDGMDGNIINLLDQRVWNLTPHFTSYTLSKSGLWSLTQTLALALAPQVRVNGIGPGPSLPSSRPERGGFRTPVGRDTARAWHDAGRDLRRRTLHPVGTRHDGPDDRSRRRAAPGMGDAARPAGAGMRRRRLTPDSAARNVSLRTADSGGGKAPTLGDRGQLH